MKISEMIDELEAIKDDHGDIEVLGADHCYNRTIRKVNLDFNEVWTVVI
jgi:hypothetical protein